VLSQSGLAKEEQKLLHKSAEVLKKAMGELEQ
jgi:hypothetical protein